MSTEAWVGEILVRVGLSVGALAISITALIIAVRTRTTDYPAKLANKLAEHEADIQGFELMLTAALSSIKSINGKMAAYSRHGKHAAEDRAARESGVDSAAPSEPLTVDKVLWDRMSPVQRQGLTDQGYTAAG